jgi:hypothetical protein
MGGRIQANDEINRGKAIRQFNEIDVNRSM